jgi:hypothetical protein
VAGVLAATRLQLQAALSSAAPAATSSLWQPVATTAYTSGVYPIARRPAGSRTWGRARLTGPGRIPSAWAVSPTGVLTSALAAPTGLASTSIRAAQAGLHWTNGETKYPVRLYVDTSTAAALSTANAVRSMAPRTAWTWVLGLHTSTKYLAAVAHYDDYGAVSSPAKAVLTTLSASSANYPQAPAPHGLWLVTGKA